jgi:hypothetical protein
MRRAFYFSSGQELRSRGVRGWRRQASVVNTGLARGGSGLFTGGVDQRESHNHRNRDGRDRRLRMSRLTPLVGIQFGRVLRRTGSPVRTGSPANGRGCPSKCFPYATVSELDE